MNASAGALRAQLALRIRTVSPAAWQRFSTLCMAFNTIYGGQPDARERSRVTACVRRFFNEKQALRVLRPVTRSIDRILEVPPGNLSLDARDPRFRATSQRYAAIYRDRSETAVNRLAAVAAVLYQIRCNLIHGDKDPDNDRDIMLIHESNSVLELLLPGLEEATRNEPEVP